MLPVNTCRYLTLPVVTRRYHKIPTDASMDTRGDHRIPIDIIQYPGFYPVGGGGAGGKIPPPNCVVLV